MSSFEQKTLVSDEGRVLHAAHINYGAVVLLNEFDHSMRGAVSC